MKFYKSWLFSKRQNLCKEMSQEGYPGGEMESELERASYYQEGN